MKIDVYIPLTADAALLSVQRGTKVTAGLKGASPGL